MAGLLGEGFDDPRSSAIMQLAGGLLRGDFGGGLLGADAAVREARQNAMKQQFMNMQMQNLQSEVEARKLQMAKQQQLQNMVGSLFGGGAPAPAPAQIGQLGSGSFGVVAPPAGQPDIAQPQPRRSGLGGASIDQIAALHALGGPDLLNAYKVAQEGFERKPGSFYDIPGRGREYVGDPTKGITYDGNQVGVMPGFLQAQSALAMASEAPKALLNAAGTVNLRDNPDGTKSPRSVYSEAPELQNILGRFLGGAQPASVPAPQPMSSGITNPGNMRPVGASTGFQSFKSPEEGLAAMDQNLRAYAGKGINTVTGVISRWAPPSENDTASYIKDVSTRLGVRPDQPIDLNNPLVRQAMTTAIMLHEQGPSRVFGQQPQGRPAYGKTTQQEIQAAADKEQAVQGAKDVAEQRKGIMAAGFNAPANIAKYQQIGKLLADVDGGTLTPTGTHLASTMNSLGFKVDKNLSNKEAAMSLANEAALQLRNPAGGAGMPGAMSDSDRQFLASMTPNMAQTAQGRKMVIDAYVAVQHRNAQVADFARKYEKKFGKLDNDFFNQLSAWSMSNPLFKGQ